MNANRRMKEERAADTLPASTDRLARRVAIAQVDVVIHGLSDRDVGNRLGGEERTGPAELT